MASFNFSALIHNYCQLHQLPAPKLDHNISCCIEPKEGPPVVIAWDEERDDLVIIIPLSEETQKLDAKQAYEILCDAFVGQNFDGAAIGIDPSTGVLSLWRRLACEAASLSRLSEDIERTSATAQKIFH